MRNPVYFSRVHWTATCRVGSHDNVCAAGFCRVISCRAIASCVPEAWDALAGWSTESVSEVRTPLSGRVGCACCGKFAGRVPSPLAYADVLHFSELALMCMGCFQQKIRISTRSVFQYIQRTSLGSLSIKKTGTMQPWHGKEWQ